LQDYPLRRYSTDQEPEVVDEFNEARRAGLDGLVMSWNGVNRPLRLAIRAAHETGLLVSTLIETAAARAGNHRANPIDPNILQRWIAEIVDKHGSDSAYLTVATRPVVFVYAADLVQASVWRDIMTNLRAHGRNPLVVGEGGDLSWLDVLDGRFTYATAGLAADEIGRYDVAQSLRVRTHHLLVPPIGERRVWAATVSPGYDDRLLADHIRSSASATMALSTTRSGAPRLPRDQTGCW